MALYAALKRSIPMLVACLAAAEDEKTRANAAGALGNLVRNGGAMCSALLAAEAPQVLLRMAERGGGREAASARRIALFSLGTLCVYAGPRAALGDMGPRIAAIEADAATDAKLGEFATRLRTKLAQSAVATPGVR